MATLSASTKEKIDALYGEAVERGRTYERVVHTHFCDGMTSLFGEDENLNAETQAAFSYARQTYGYLSADEDSYEEEGLWAGLCQHGMDKDTCPGGCFEF